MFYYQCVFEFIKKINLDVPKDSRTLSKISPSVIDWKVIEVLNIHYGSKSGSTDFVVQSLWILLVI